MMASSSIARRSAWTLPQQLPTALLLILRAFALLLCVCLTFDIASAQIARPLTLGLYLQDNLNLHSANFQTLPGVPGCCPLYERGSGTGFGGGLTAGLPIADLFALNIKLGLANYDATLRTLENTTVLINGVETHAEIEHSVDATIRMLSLPLFLTYRWQRLGFSVGPLLNFKLSNNYSQREILQQPQVGTFENGRRIRSESSGATPDALPFNLAASAAVRYRLPLNNLGTLEAVPELSASYGLTPIVKGMSWFAHTVSFGVAIEYKLPAGEEVVTPVLAKDTSTPSALPAAPPLRADVRIAALDSDAHEQSVQTLIIEDYIRTQYRPLLNYVFFDEGSASLAGRYHNLTPNETNEFNFASLSSSGTLALYHELLNLIGKRMQQTPQAKITLVGCNADIGSEKGATELSRKRAESVASYLKTAWNIAPSRIAIEARGLPEKPSSVMDTDGAQENRRVEIYSNVPSILEPIFTVDTAHVPKPSILRITPTASVKDGLSSWTIVANENARKLREFSGKDVLPPYLDWEIEKERETTLAGLDTIRVAITVTDTANRTSDAQPRMVSVRHYTLADKHREGSIDTIISRYSLILFDFDRTNLSEGNKKIADFVKSRVYDESRVAISGFTDRIGTDEYNRQLSEQRARSAYDYIGFYRAIVKGIGRSILLYDNTLPEGRFYSRTVTIVVSTPTKR